MKKTIVTTTINPVTEAVELFQRKEDWELIVIGDKKTPKDYKLKHGTYVTPEMQDEYDHDLSEAIGWNCIQRRNLGLLWAYDRGAEIVAVVDDDNIPYDHWGKELLLGKPCPTRFYSVHEPAFDPVGAVTGGKLWHRGFPLQLLKKRDYRDVQSKPVTASIQADFWNGDPDIDAICRMEHAPDCQFDPSLFPIASNRLSPFNSQNTFLLRSVLKDYFLYPHIGRMDDIWAAYYVEAKGHAVVYGGPSVFQKRNEHDLTKDMKQEYLGYEHNLEIAKALPEDPEAIGKFLPPRAIEAWDLFRRHFKK